MPPSPPSSSLCSEARPPKLSKLPSNWFIGEYPSEHQQATINSYLLPERWPWESFSSSPVSSARHIKSKKSSGSISYVLRRFRCWLFFPGPPNQSDLSHPNLHPERTVFWVSDTELLQPDPSTPLEAPKLSWAPEMVRGCSPVGHHLWVNRDPVLVSGEPYITGKHFLSSTLNILNMLLTGKTLGVSTNSMIWYT